MKSFIQQIFNIKNIDNDKVLVLFGKHFSISGKLLKRLRTHNYYLEKLLLQCGDITKCKVVDQNIELLQTIRYKAFKISAKLFEKNGITYWLDGGTCLGAFRHNGFIPWDDDIDIVIPRSDCQRGIELLNDFFKPHGLAIRIGNPKPNGKKNSLVPRLIDLETNFSFMDIFPYDFSNNNTLDKGSLLEKLHEIREKFITDSLKNSVYKNKKQLADYYSELQDFYKKYEICIPDGENSYMFRAIDSMSNCLQQTIHRTDEVFPLQKVRFEDDYFYAPANMQSFLQNINEGRYGDIMAFPPLDILIPHCDREFNSHQHFIKTTSVAKKKIDAIYEEFFS